MYKVKKKNVASSPAIAMSWVTSAAARPLILKTENGSSGFSSAARSR